MRLLARTRGLGLAALLVTIAHDGLAPSPVLAQDPTAADPVLAAVAAYVQPDNAARARVLTDQLDAAGLPWTLETFEGGNSRTGPMTGTNIVVVIEARPGSALGGREILLTAHYDAVVLADGSLAHGLVDNAASVVAVIEAGRRLQADPLNHRVRLVFFDQEELGLIGARRWIEAHGTEAVAAVINSDVAAYGDTLMYGQNNGEQSGFMVRAMREVCAERALQCVGFPLYPPSDDRAFSAAGAPVISLGFQDEIGAHQMWLAFNARADSGLAKGFTPKVFRLIHSPEDRLDAVDADTVRTAAETYVALARHLDTALASVD